MWKLSNKDIDYILTKIIKWESFKTSNTFKNKVRHFIWITWSMIKDWKEYWFYWIHCKNIKFYTKQYWILLQTYYTIYNKILKKITPLLNWIIR